MKRKFWNKQTVTACFFVVSLFTYSILNVIHIVKNSDEYRTEINNDPKVETTIKSINDYIEDNVFLKYPLIESYGAIQKVLFKHEFNNFDKLLDKDGFLYDGNFYNEFGADQRLIAADSRRLMDYAKNYGAEFSFVVTPMKTVSGENAYSGLPYSDYSSQIADLLRGLRYYNVPYLDLSTSIKASQLNTDDYFYKSDHHWKTAAAFQGYQDIINWMEQHYNIILDEEKQSTNIANYNIQIYPGLMLGSYGRDVGKIYASGSEDFELYYPKNSGDYSVVYGSLDDYQTRNDDFNGALVQSDVDQKITNIYKDSCYDLAFLYGLDDYISITNNENFDAPKILMLRDSFSSPLGCFMAQNFSRIDMIYMLGEDKDQILNMIKENNYDYVMMCIYPENLTLENLQLFEETFYE